MTAGCLVVSGRVSRAALCVVLIEIVARVLTLEFTVAITAGSSVTCAVTELATASLTLLVFRRFALAAVDTNAE